MTKREGQSALTVIGIVMILLAIAGRQMIERNTPDLAVDDDDSSQSDDDDSGRFDHLPPAPKD